jgi:hypothetical protein
MITGIYFYGVREFGMIGVSLLAGFINFGATFMMFMEYACNAVRISALMWIMNIFVYTHYSIGQGEDGKPEIILIVKRTEVPLSLNAAKVLTEQGQKSTGDFYALHECL